MYYFAFLEAVRFTRCSVFSQVLAVTVRIIQKDAEEKKVSFNPRPYFRLFINWLLDLGSMDPVFDGANFQVFGVFHLLWSLLSPMTNLGFVRSDFDSFCKCISCCTTP